MLMRRLSDAPFSAICQPTAKNYRQMSFPSYSHSNAIPTRSSSDRTSLKTTEIKQQSAKNIYRPVVDTMRPPSATDNSENFVIHGGGNDFANRQRQIFEQLSQAAREWKKDRDSCPSEMELEIVDRRGESLDARSPSRPRTGLKRSETRQYRGKESIFKRPEGPAPLAVRKIIPDHHKNPHKWVKYSLEDVRTEQMSDRSNAQAAFSFLKELRARRKRESCEDEQDVMDTDEPKPEGGALAVGCKFTTRVQFRKSTESRDGREPPVVVVERDERPVFRNSKIILPEYVVGQKAERRIKKTRPVVKIDRSKQLKLAHLDEPDE